MRIIINMIISIVMRILYHSLFRITVGDKDYNHFPGTIIKIFSIHFASGTLFPEAFFHFRHFQIPILFLSILKM